MDLSKLFAAWGTGSKADPFRTARFRLTLLYMGIIAAVVLVLSSALYEFHTHDVSGIERRRIVSAPEGEKQGERDPGLGEYLESLGRSMVFADLVTILVGGALSYVLAARTLRPIKRAVESEQRFYANAAHDLRTPLAVMRTEAEVLLRSAEPRLEDARKTLVSSLEEIERMSKMVEQMLSLARGDIAHPGGRAPFRHTDLPPSHGARLQKWRCGPISGESVFRLKRRFVWEFAGILWQSNARCTTSWRTQSHTRRRGGA